MQVATRHLGEAGSPEPVLRLPSSAYRSLAFQAKEDAAIWTREWVGLGFAADVAGPGDILPVTVGNHGVHLERRGDGAIVGRFNKAQHGGCRAVPLQCQTGTKTKCSFTACGYSRDRRSILAGDADRLQHLDQYLGLRPERLLTVATQSWGPVVAGRLDPLATSAFDWPDAAVGFELAAAMPCGETLWLEREANWKHVMIALAASERGVITTVRFPNVALLAAGEWICCLVVHPTALQRTLCRVRLFTTGNLADTKALVDEALAALVSCFERADAWQAGGERVDADAVRHWFEGKVAAAFEARNGETQSGPLFRTNDGGLW